MFRIFSLSHARVYRGRHSLWRSQNITAISTRRGNKITENKIRCVFWCDRELAWQSHEASLPERLSYTKLPCIQCPVTLNSSDVHYTYIVATPYQWYYIAYRSVYGGTVQSVPDTCGSPGLLKRFHLCLDKACLVSQISGFVNSWRQGWYHSLNIALNVTNVKAGP